MKKWRKLKSRRRFACIVLSAPGELQVRRMNLPILSAHSDRSWNPDTRFQGWTPSLSDDGGKSLGTILFHPRRLFAWSSHAAKHLWRNRRYLTFLKVANVVLVSIQQRLKTEYVLGRPFQLSIEPTNVCATKCKLCPTGQRLHGRPKGSMDFDEYCRLIDGCKRWTYTLNLFQWGDPLNAPRIYDMIRYAHDAGIFTHISTTLAPFEADPSAAEAVVRSGLNLLSCSLHGASDTTYSHYQGDHLFAEAIAKLKLIIEARDRLRSDTPKIQMHFVVTRFNEHEIEQFAQLAEQLGCRPMFSAASLNLRFLAFNKKHEPLYITAEELEEKVKARIDEWLPRDPRYVFEPYRKIRDGAAQFRDFGGQKVVDCEWPWKAVVVNWDSRVSVCCGSWTVSQDYGDLKQHSWGEVWNSPVYRLARRSFKRPAVACGSSDVACVNCPGAMM